MRGSRIVRGALAAAVVALATFAVAPVAVAAAEPLQAGVGAGDGTISGNAFLPGAFTVRTGDTVRWSWLSDEAHSLTFGDGPTGTAPNAWPVTGFTAPASTTGPVDLGTATYDGTGFVNTGLLAKGSSASMTFTKAGTYGFICVIHPGMEGTITVVDAGTTTTQAEADAAAAQTRDALLSQAASLQAEQASKISVEKRPDGTNLVKVFTDAKTDPAEMPGGGNGYLELLQFIPPTLTIGPGDTVQWTADSPHTVTFPAPGSDPWTMDPFTTQVTSDATYDPERLANSGVLALGADAPTTFSLTFDTSGDFQYLCLLHGQLGQTGTITVQQVGGLQFGAVLGIFSVLAVGMFILGLFGVRGAAKDAKIEHDAPS
jgi:plastocyanin